MHDSAVEYDGGSILPEFANAVSFGRLRTASAYLNRGLLHGYSVLMGLGIRMIRHMGASGPGSCSLERHGSATAPLRDPGYGQIYGNNGRYQT